MVLAEEKGGGGGNKGGKGGRDSRNPAGGKPDPSKCLLMFHGKGADFIGALMGTCH